MVQVVDSLELRFLFVGSVDSGSTGNGKTDAIVSTASSDSLEGLSLKAAPSRGYNTIHSTESLEFVENFDYKNVSLFSDLNPSETTTVKQRP